jgi:hypothetical protein
VCEGRMAVESGLEHQIFVEPVHSTSNHAGNINSRHRRTAPRAASIGPNGIPGLRQPELH